MLNRVTLTGADDSVEPGGLRRLWEDFPFVEFGVLIGSRVGHRFPSLNWIGDLLKVMPPIADLSLHICGERLDAIMEGKPDIFEFLNYPQRFQRCQLNFHGESVPSGTDAKIRDSFEKLRMHYEWEPEIIFQMDGVNDNLMHLMSTFPVSGLFDGSHGAGRLPSSWREPRPNFKCGYAGGLGPKNVVEELKKIQAVVIPDRPFWIDMETKLYDEDGRFSIDKCRQVLELTKPFIGS